MHLLLEYLNLSLHLVQFLILSLELVPHLSHYRVHPLQLKLKLKALLLHLLQVQQRILPTAESLSAACGIVGWLTLELAGVLENDY